MEKKRYVGVMVKCKDKILLCKRNTRGSFPGMWSIPAGNLEDGETTLGCAKREFFEETAIDINDSELRFIGVLPNYNKSSNKIKGLMYVYLMNVDNEISPDFENAVDGDEHTDWGYFSINNIRPETSGEHLYKLAKVVLTKK